MIVERDVVDKVALYPNLKQVRVTISHKFVDDSIQEVKAQNDYEQLFVVTNADDCDKLRVLLGTDKANLIIANL